MSEKIDSQNPRNIEIAELAGYEHPSGDNYWLNFGFNAGTKKLTFLYTLMWVTVLINFYSLIYWNGVPLYCSTLVVLFVLFVPINKGTQSVFEEFYHKGLEIRDKEESKRQELMHQNEEKRKDRERKTEEHAWNSKIKLAKKSIEAGGIKKLKEAIEITRDLLNRPSFGFMFGETISGPDKKIEIVKELETEAKTKLAKQHEKLMEFDEAAEIYKELELEDEVIKVRKLKSEQGVVKVTQKVVHGDEVTKTEIKDSVLNRSNIGGKSSKAEELREAKSLLDEGLINEDDYEKMKKEILGK